MDDHPELQKLMGIPDISCKCTGTTHLPTQDVNRKREVVPPVEWHTTQVAKLSQLDLHGVLAHKLFYHVNSVMTIDGDTVLPASFIILQHPIISELLIGKVVEILSPHCSPFNMSHVVITRLEFLPNLHSHLPCLREAVPKERVIFMPNVGQSTVQSTSIG